MSTTDATQAKCAYCGDNRDLDGFKGSFCGPKCYYRHKGEKALKNIQTDHTLCASCGSRIKTTEGPSEDWEHSHGSHYEQVIQAGGELVQTEDGITLDATEIPDIRPTDVSSIVGHEYHTEHATQGVDEQDSVFHPIQYERVSCGNCGTVNPNDDPHEFLREIDTAKLLVRVLKRMREKYTEGRIPEKISKQAFFDAYKESGGDLPYAVGRGIYG